MQQVTRDSDGHRRSLHIDWGVINGALFGGTPAAIAKLHALYYRMLDGLVSLGAQPTFVVEQDVFSRLYLHAPTLWALVPSPLEQWCFRDAGPLQSARRNNASLLVAEDDWRECDARPSRRDLSRPCHAALTEWMYILSWLARVEELPEQDCRRTALLLADKPTVITTRSAGLTG